jgi:hypothetical protein
MLHLSRVAWYTTRPRPNDPCGFLPSDMTDTVVRDKENPKPPDSGHVAKRDATVLPKKASIICDGIDFSRKT